MSCLVNCQRETESLSVVSRNGIRDMEEEVEVEGGSKESERDKTGVSFGRI